MGIVRYPPVGETIRDPAAGPLALGLGAQLLVLVALAQLVGLGVAGWLAGAGYAAVTGALFRRALRRADLPAWGLAHTITLVRATLIGGVTALVAASFGAAPAPPAAVAGLAAVALLLDGVDGPVARRTGTPSRFGARFDMETDALLVLVLSVYVAGVVGWWALAVGVARYAYAVAAWRWPWLHQPLPARRSRKVVAAAQGMVLVVASAGVLPVPLAGAALATVLALLAWSFGRDIGWLRRSRAASVPPGGAVPPGDAVPPDAPEPAPERSRRRRVLGRAATVAAAVLVLAALLVPNRLGQLTPAAVLRLPAEGLLAAALVLALPPRPRRVAAALAGAVLGLLAILKIMDMGFFSVLARPFDPVLDWSLLGAAVGFLAEAVGRTGAVAIATGAGVLAVVLLALMVLAAWRLAAPLARHRRRAAGALGALGAGWVVCALLGVQLVPGLPVATHQLDRAAQLATSLRDRQAFLAESSVDAFAGTPGEQLLTGLRGRDVLLVYVESYGRSAIEDPRMSIDDVLADGQRRLAGAGFESRSAYLSSPTVGGTSWLAHATLRSGLWVDNPLRYRMLVEGDRFTLNHAFQRAGWRTVAVMPGIFEEWPEGESFGYDWIYDAEFLGYQGPRMNWGIIPDQYTLSVLQQRERSRPDRPPLMAEIPLVSSHGPWHPIPTLTGWEGIGDGSVFEEVPHAAPEEPWSDPAGARVAYRSAVAYSVRTLISYMEEYGDDDLVLIFLGDHQPSPVITGEASSEVPISIVTRDPAVLERIAGWGWDTGLRPGQHAPVWPMDEFRDRFLTTFE